MGNICQACKEGKEQSKPSAFTSGDNNNGDHHGDENSYLLNNNSRRLPGQQQNDGLNDPNNPMDPANMVGSHHLTGGGDHHDGITGGGDPTKQNDTMNNTANGGVGGTSSTTTEALLLQQKKAKEAEEERQRALREEQARLEHIVSTAGRDMVPLHGGSGGGGGNANSGGGGMYNNNGGGGGSNMAYYDPGYAASITQDLCNPNYGLPNGGFVAGLHALYNDEMEASSKSSAIGCDRVPNGSSMTCVTNGVEAVSVLSSRIDFSDSVRRGISTLDTSGNSSSGGHNSGFMGSDDYLDSGVSNPNGNPGVSSTGVVVGSLGGGTAAGTAGGGGGDGSVEFLLEDVAERFLASVLCSKEVLFQDLKPIVENLP